MTILGYIKKALFTQLFTVYSCLGLTWEEKLT